MSDGGTIKSVYLLDIADVQKKAAELKRLFEGIQKTSTGGRSGTPPAPDEVKYAQAIAKTAQAQAQAALATNRRIESDAKAAKAVAATALIDQKRATEAAKTAKADDQAALSAQRRAAAEKRAAQGGGGSGPALPRTFAGFTPQGLAQAAGFTLGPQLIGETIRLGVESGKAAIALRETKNSLKAVAPDAKAYADTILLARQQQALFGGSLQENIEGLQGLTVASRQSGASVKTLLDLSQRLNVLSPEQGTQGARIALSEALSGNITSLSRRFEIPKSALKGLADESLNVEERLKVLDTFLNNVGVTSAAVAGKVDQDALAYRRLGQELGDLQTGGGDQLATAFSGTATGLARVVGLINRNPQAIAELRSLLGIDKGPVDAGRVEGITRDLAEAQARRAFGGGAGLGQSTAQNRLGGAEQFKVVIEQMTQMQLKGGLAAATADQLAAALQRGELSGAAFSSQLGALVVRETEGADAEDRRVQAINAGKKATDEATNAIRAELQEKIKSQVETGKLTELQTQLERDSQLAAQGLLGAGNQAVLMANKYRLATDEAEFLIRQQQQLSNATALADQRVGERDPSNNLTAAQNEKFGKIARQGAIDRQNEAKQAADKARQDADRLADLQLQGRLTNAKTSAQKIAILQGQLAKTTDPIERQQLINSIDQERLSAAKSLGSAADKRLKTEESIYDSIQKQRDAMLDIEELSITGRQKDRDDVQKLKTANAILNSPNASADFKARAADAAALIDVQNRKRDFELEQKRATAGGAITSQGRLLQSQAGGGIPAPAQASAGGASGAPVAAPSASAGTLTVNVIIDGKVAWSGMSSYAWEDFIRGARALQVGG